MKRILYFIGLKIAEILGIFIIYYGLCWGWVIFEIVFKLQYKETAFWFGGLLALACCFIIFAFGMILYVWIYENWKKAGKLSE